jgi:hypothetical protein
MMMCIHSEASRQKYEEMLKKDNSPVRTVSLKSPAGKLIAAWPTTFSDSQKVSNTIRDLKNWHEDKECWVDLSAVNEARLAKGLEALDNEGLPFAIGEPLPQDMDVDLIMRGRNGLTEFERGVRRYAQAQELQLKELVRVPVMVGA